MTTMPMAPDALEAALRAIGAERYHIHHPFHRLLHDGRCTRAQVQAWALNRYYYQAMIPVKDASLLARLPTPKLRREWRRLKTLLGQRIAEGLAGGISTKSIDAIIDEELGRDDHA